MRLPLVVLACAALGPLAAACTEDPNILTNGRDPRKPGGMPPPSSSADYEDETPTSTSSSSSSGSSSSSSSTGGTSTTPTGTTPEEICVAEINRYRQTLGRPALARWTDAEVCSDDQAESDAATRNAHGAFGKCSESAQNECPGWPGPSGPMIKSCLKAMWGEGPGGGHYENMASRQYTKVACGFHTTASGSIWSVQNFR